MKKPLTPDEIAMFQRALNHVAHKERVNPRDRVGDQVNSTNVNSTNREGSQMMSDYLIYGFCLALDATVKVCIVATAIGAAVLVRKSRR